MQLYLISSFLFINLRLLYNTNQNKNITENRMEKKAQIKLATHKMIMRLIIMGYKMSV